MAFAFVQQFIGTQNKTANQTTIVGTASITVNVGDWIVICIAKDSTSSGGEQTDMSVADSAGNTYTRVRERVGSGGAQLHSHVGMFFSQIENEIEGGVTTITVTLGGNQANNDAQAFVGLHFTKDADDVLFQAESNAASAGGGDPQSISLSSLASRPYLFVHCIAFEGVETDGWTADGDYTQLSGAHTSGGGATTNQSIVASVRSATLSSETFDGELATDRDYSQILAAFYEDVPLSARVFDHHILIHAV